MKSNWIIFILLLTTATVFPQIVSKETFKFGNCRKFKQLLKISNFLPNKLNFCCENYSRGDAICGNTVYFQNNNR